MTINKLYHTWKIANQTTPPERKDHPHPQYHLADCWYLSKPFGLLEPNFRKDSCLGKTVEYHFFRSVEFFNRLISLAT